MKKFNGTKKYVATADKEINGKIAFVENCDGVCTGSTELHVLRGNKEKILPRFLFYFIIKPHIKIIKEVKVYYELNPRDKKNSEAFLNRIKKTGANLRPNPPKEMKFIKKILTKLYFFSVAL